MQYSGISAHPGNFSGRLCIIKKEQDMDRCKAGDLVILAGVKPNANLVKRAGAIAAVHGGITSHAAIAARENNKPAVVGLPEELLEHARDGMHATLHADQGILECY